MALSAIARRIDELEARLRAGGADDDCELWRLCAQHAAVGRQLRDLRRGAGDPAELRPTLRVRPIRDSDLIMRDRAEVLEEVDRYMDGEDTVRIKFTAARRSA
jgi:hypothetical protein